MARKQLTFVCLDDVELSYTHLHEGMFLTLDEVIRATNECHWIRVEVCDSKRNALIVNMELAC
jgi:hypothetical protein